MAVPFTQFLLPDGRQKEIEISLDPDVEAKAQDIIAAGYKFEIEILRTGIISATIADPIQEEDVAHALMRNGIQVPPGITKMIENFVIPEDRKA